MSYFFFFFLMCLTLEGPPKTPHFTYALLLLKSSHLPGGGIASWPTAL